MKESDVKGDPPILVLEKDEEGNMNKKEDTDA